MATTRLTKVQSFMLYSLGICYAEFEVRFASKPVSFVMNKTDFIDLVHKARIADKKDRAVYKNLQDLEEKKYIAYDNKTLALTQKGKKEFERVRAEIIPYIDVTGILADDILRYTEKRQTVLR